MTKKTTTLAADEIETSRGVGRRSAMTAVAWGGLALVGLSAQACHGGGCTDSDTGPTRDAAGSGRHCCTDRDATDAANHGIHCGTTGCTDSDPTDTAGNGHHCI